MVPMWLLRKLELQPYSIPQNVMWGNLVGLHRRLAMLLKWM